MIEAKRKPLRYLHILSCGLPVTRLYPARPPAPKLSTGDMADLYLRAAKASRDAKNAERAEREPLGDRRTWRPR